MDHPDREQAQFCDADIRITFDTGEKLKAQFKNLPPDFAREVIRLARQRRDESEEKGG